MRQVLAGFKLFVIVGLIAGNWLVFDHAPMGAAPLKRPFLIPSQHDKSQLEFCRQAMSVVVGSCRTGSIASILV